MKLIPLTQGKYAMVDDDMFNELIKYKWRAIKNRNTYYAFHTRWNEGNPITLLMHRLIINIPEGYMCDHINHNGLDNQRSNLRPVTNRENQQNRTNKKTSKYPGVDWQKNSNKWRAKIKIKGKAYHLGMYENEEKAFEAYCAALALINEPYELKGLEVQV